MGEWRGVTAEVEELMDAPAHIGIYHDYQIDELRRVLRRAVAEGVRRAAESAQELAYEYTRDRDAARENAGDGFYPPVSGTRDDCDNRAIGAAGACARLRDLADAIEAGEVEV